MSKNLKIILGICAVVVIAAIAYVLFGNTKPADTFMEKRVKYAVDYTEANLEDTEEYQIGNTLMEEQSAAIDSLKEEYAAGDYTLDNPFIAVDPYSQNNLSAYIVFTNDNYESYDYEVQAKEDDGYPFGYSAEVSGDTVIIPVVGLYSDYANTVTVTMVNKDGEEVSSDVEVVTEAAEDKFREGSSNATEMEKEAGIKMTEEQAAAIGVPLENVTTDTVTTEIYDDSVMDLVDGFILSEDYDIYDFNGNLRFSSLIGAGNNPLKIADGMYLTIGSDHIMYEMDYMGRVYQYYFPPVSDENNEELVFHHDAVVTPDNKYIYVLAGYNNVSDIEENQEDYLRETMIFKYDRESGEFLDVIDMSEEFRDSMQTNAGAPSADDPLHMNSVDYYEEKDMLIISMKNQGSVIGVNATTGELEWLIKSPDAVAEENKEYLLDDMGSEGMMYTSGNHTAFIINNDTYTSSGDDLYISVFDNKHCLDENGDPKYASIGEDNTCSESPNSSMVIYHINLADMTVELEQEIIPEEGRWSTIRSSVYTTIDGIYEINYADMTDDEGNSVTHSDLYITDEEGNLLMAVGYDGMTNVYRSRLINEDEVASSLDTNVSSLA